MHNMAPMEHRAAWLVLVLLMTSLATVVTSQLMLDVDQSQLMPGDTLTLTCSVPTSSLADNPKPVVQIYKTKVNLTIGAATGYVDPPGDDVYIGLISNDTEVNPELGEQTDRYHVYERDDGNRRTYTLNITDAQPEDGGYFSCRRISQDTGGEALGGVTFHAPEPVEVVVTGPPRSLEILVDHYYSGNEALYLAKHNITTPQDNTVDSTLYNTEQDAITYTMLERDQVHLECHVNVSNVAPRLYVTMEGEGMDNLDLIDSFRVVPNMHAVRGAGGLVYFTASIHLEPYGFRGLRIRHQYHNRLLTCAAEVPGYPVHTIQYRMNVTFSPQPPQCTVYTEPGEKRTDNVRVQCTLKANPAPEITWYDAQNQEVDLSSNRHRQTIQSTAAGDTTAVLYVYDLSEGDYTDQYTMQAANDYGDVRTGFSLDDRVDGGGGGCTLASPHLVVHITLCALLVLV